MKKLIVFEPGFVETIEINQDRNDLSNSFDQIFSDAVDCALLMLGYKAQQLVYRYLEEKYSISRSLLLEKANLFSQAIRSLLGQSALLIEDKILGELAIRANLYQTSSNKHSDWNFVAHIAELKYFYS